MPWISGIPTGAGSTGMMDLLWTTGFSRVQSQMAIKAMWPIVRTKPGRPYPYCKGNSVPEIGYGLAEPRDFLSFRGTPAQRPGARWAGGLSKAGA